MAARFGWSSAGADFTRSKTSGPFRLRTGLTASTCSSSRKYTVGRAARGGGSKFPGAGVAVSEAKSVSRVPSSAKMVTFSVLSTSNPFMVSAYASGSRAPRVSASDRSKFQKNDFIGFKAHAQNNLCRGGAHHV